MHRSESASFTELLGEFRSLAGRLEARMGSVEDRIGSLETRFDARIGSLATQVGETIARVDRSTVQSKKRNATQREIDFVNENGVGAVYVPDNNDAVAASIPQRNPPPTMTQRSSRRTIFTWEEKRLIVIFIDSRKVEQGYTCDEKAIKECLYTLPDGRYKSVNKQRLSEWRKAILEKRDHSTRSKRTS